MKTSDDGIALIKQSEGFRPEPYKDVAGKFTIGYGHLIKAGETFLALTEEQADAMLRKDVVTAENAVNKQVMVALTQGQFDALVDFTFNLGAGALAGSTLMQRLNAGDFEAAADNFQKWVFAGGVRQPGLIRRRAAEWALFTGKDVV